MTSYIAEKEFDLNLKHQIGEVKIPMFVSYCWDETIIVAGIFLPKKILEAIKKC